MSGQTERFNRTMHTILNHYVAEHPRSWDQLLGALTLEHNCLPHRGTGVAPLELVNPIGMSSWAFKDVSRTGAYPVPGPAQHPALRVPRSFHGAKADGQRYAVDRIADHATFPDETLRVQVYWTEYPHITWMDGTDAPYETLRIYLRPAARLGCPHTSADRPPAAPFDAAPAFGAAAGVAAAPAPAVRA